ncbi:hypothetical protein E1B28_006770 [Marasmius oreades]|uniref:Uncharacterized protein n=1 Tax=Marasmius oreades TaxID=181124 RepID=A0A9P7UWT1_9AGAR|nr:uncharacterized protein E1B28_006770 [Marasmius oreades]KAG7096094.1 hypothetical protein E1B28_006770 [Marasmius oreades]
MLNQYRLNEALAREKVRANKELVRLNELNKALGIGSQQNGKQLRSTKGLVGTVFEEQRVFLTSPNSPHMVDPLVGTRRIHLWHDLHFGLEDPVFHPQPIKRGTEHLALIPYSTTDYSSPHLVAWKMLREINFEPAAPTDLSRGLGKLSKNLRRSMQERFPIRTKQLSDVIRLVAASQSAGIGFDSNTPPPNGCDNRYALPNPNVIAGTANKVTSEASLRTWLKLHPVLLYWLQSLTFCPLRARDWRAVLGMEVHGLKENTHAAAVQKTQEKMLQECLVSGEMVGSINLLNLAAAPVRWNGAELSSLIPISIVKEICYWTEKSFHDREVMVIGTMLYFRYSMIPCSLEQGKMGFSSKDLNITAGRYHAVWGLLMVMKGWKGGPGELPPRLQDPLVEQQLDI